MSQGITNQAEESLSDMVDHIRGTGATARETWLGKRKSPRYELAVPVWVRSLGEQGIGPAVRYLLRDLSGSAMGFTSKLTFEAEQPLLVELCVNNAWWRGRMRVAHCTETIGGYKVGLELIDPSLSQTSPGDDMETIRHLRELMSLGQAKSEIKTAMRAYHLARLSWGLLGTSLKKQIRELIKGLPPVPDANAEECRRRRYRLYMEGDVHTVIRASYGWKRLPARIVDVSEGGVGLLIPLDGVDDPVERELAGEFRLQPEMSLVVGLGVHPEILWVPAEICHCAAEDDSAFHVGVRFITDGSTDHFNT